MNTEQRILIIEGDLKNCKAVKYVLTEYASALVTPCLCCMVLSTELSNGL